ncbi:hypothetical protein BDV27DRAFT_164739 [Aspergillus caelatus]|uniref:Uncharacterized protein n=1 Tax=Aspergillus caelatus TaxID=61420 RepID=A0A5N6ZHR1_9EURO|nr:uncharacterized protein BDV27DRAFT_164739 [Aspergillus caelatus]KAE8357197.1 hypothetical protein BDV27DRAFT_164739 [Aspergillus caelatus]
MDPASYVADNLAGLYPVLAYFANNNRHRPPNRAPLNSSILHCFTPSGLAATSATSTTVVPVWVQAGGFYWSPVPKPTPKPGHIPVPPLPSFPPIPTASCFKLFDLFSIDCPPNRFLPTTTFSSQAPSPTCTDINSPGCGHRCTSNCGSSSSEECTTQTATNYWVTCSGTSCSTTRTATFAGCSVTNSATTTGKYCPTGVKIDPNDDQGANGYPPRTTSTITTSIPEIVIVGGEPYTVTGGTINVDGTTIRVPNVGGNEQVSTTIGNVPMVIIPSYSGMMVVPVFPTAKPTSNSKPDPTTTSKTTSTTSTTRPTNPAPTSADGCGLIRKQDVCWNKCDPITGKATVQTHSNVNQVVGLEVDAEGQSQIPAVAP